MTELLQIFAAKLRAYLDDTTFNAISAHLLLGIGRTTDALCSATCADTPDISYEVVMTTLSDAVLNLLHRYPTPITPANVNTLISAAFTLVIAQFYGEDTIKDVSAKLLFLAHYGIPPQQLFSHETNLCQDLHYNIGLSRQTDGELTSFPTQALSSAELDHFDTRCRLESSVLRFLSIHSSKLSNLKTHLSFIAEELYSLLTPIFPKEELTSQLAGIPVIRFFNAFRAQLALAPPSATKLYLIERLSYFYSEKLALQDMNQLTCTMFDNQDELPANYLNDTVSDILLEDEETLTLRKLFENGKDADFIKQFKNQLHQDSRYCYLVGLKQLRTNMFKTSIERLYPENTQSQAYFIEKISCKRIANEFSYSDFKDQIKKSSQSGLNTIQLGLEYANYRYQSLPVYRRLYAQLVVSSLNALIQHQLLYAYNQAAGKQLLKVLSNHFIDDNNDAQMSLDLHIFIMKLNKAPRLDTHKVITTLRHAFWQAIEYHTAIGYELLVRSLIIKKFGLGDNFSSWPIQCKTLLITLVSDYYQKNTLSLDTGSFVKAFDYHLANPSLNNVELKNVHQYNLTLIENQLDQWDLNLSDDLAEETTVARPRP